MKKLKTLLLTLGLFAFGTVQATPVAIDSLFVEEGSLTVEARWLTGSLSGSFDPVEITMGSYQNPIISVSGPFGSHATIFSTDAYGMPAPSGMVDGTSIDVDLSSLRLDATFLGHDVPLWPITTPLDMGFYDPLTGDFELTWMTQVGSGWYAKDITVSLSGYLTTAVVPVPAAVWLFGSGLLALVGFARRKVV